MGPGGDSILSRLSRESPGLGRVGSFSLSCLLFDLENNPITVASMVCQLGVDALSRCLGNIPCSNQATL